MFPTLPLAACIILGWICAAHGGAFLEPAGEGLVIATAMFSGSTKEFDGSGRMKPVASYRKFELGTYVEYGATDWLTLVATPSFDHIESAPSLGSTSLGSTSPGRTQSTTGIGDTAVGARAGLYQTPGLVISVQGLARPPLGLQTDSANQSLSHSRIWGGEIRGLAGASRTILGFDSFADIAGGYRWNDQETPDEWRADVTLGVHATPALMFLAQNFAAISNGRTASNPSYYWDKEQISGVYSFNQAWSAQLGGFLTIAGRNAGRELGPLAALWYRF